VSGRALWLVSHGKAHLLESTRADFHQDRGVSWCRRSLPKGLSEAKYEPRCQSCLAAINELHAEATARLPELIVETVLVQVTRPAEQVENLADYITRHVKKKTSWTDVAVQLHEVKGVD
jgi:hypothetical protein